jgi:hypothetical protein
MLNAKEKNMKIIKRKRKSASRPHSDNPKRKIKKSIDRQSNNQIVMVNQIRYSDA